MGTESRPWFLCFPTYNGLLQLHHGLSPNLVLTSEVPQWRRLKHKSVQQVTRRRRGIPPAGFASTCQSSCLLASFTVRMSRQLSDAVQKRTRYFMPGEQEIESAVAHMSSIRSHSSEGSVFPVPIEVPPQAPGLGSIIGLVMWTIRWKVHLWINEHEPVKCWSGFDQHQRQTANLLSCPFNNINTSQPRYWDFLCRADATCLSTLYNNLRDRLDKITCRLTSHRHESDGCGFYSRGRCGKASRQSL